MKHAERAKPFVLTPDALRVPDQKRDLNAQLFAVVAPRYDFITRALSLGRDAAWKRRMVHDLPKLDAPFCVDLACGTGDVAFLLGAKYPSGRVLGVDLTESMLNIARERCPYAHVRFTQGDMMHLNLADGCADVVTGSYAIRNAPDLGGALDEIARILKPGGVGVFLDFSKPPARWAQALEYALLKIWGDFWGRMAHGNADVYGYIAESLSAFPDRIALRALLARRGLETVAAQRFYGGVIELFRVQKG